jgi:hypothetical protein
MEPLGDARGEEGDFTFAGLMFLKPVNCGDGVCFLSGLGHNRLLGAGNKINNLYSDEHNLASFAP